MSLVGGETLVPAHSQFKPCRSFNDIGKSGPANQLSATSSDNSQAAVTYSQYKLGEKQDLEASFMVMHVQKSPDLVSKIVEAPSEEAKGSPTDPELAESNKPKELSGKMRKLVTKFVELIEFLCYFNVQYGSSKARKKGPGYSRDL